MKIEKEKTKRSEKGKNRKENLVDGMEGKGMGNKKKGKEKKKEEEAAGGNGDGKNGWDVYGTEWEGPDRVMEWDEERGEKGRGREEEGVGTREKQRDKESEGGSRGDVRRKYEGENEGMRLRNESEGKQGWGRLVMRKDEGNDEGRDWGE